MVQEIRDILSRADKVIAHNMKFEMLWLQYLGIKINNPYCTFVMEYLINGQNNRLGYSLEDSCIRRGLKPKLDVVKTEYWDKGVDTCDIPLETLLEYCYMDVEITLDLYKEQQKESIIPSLKKLMHLQNSFVECLMEIESNGMVVDIPHLDKQQELFTKRLEGINEKLSYYITDHVPELRDIPYSLTSNDHLSAILYGGIVKYDSTEWVTREYKTKPPRTYERACVKECVVQGLGFKPKESDKTKKEGYYKTNKEVMAQLKGGSKTTKEFLAIVREQADVSKVLSTYLTGMKKLIPKGSNVVHPPFNQALTVTGRLSSFFQTLPRGSTPETVVVKRSFITRYV